MIEGLIGRKVGMTQIINDNGEMIPVTVIKAGPCVVVQRKSEEKDGYEAVQLGLIENNKVKSLNKPLKGHLEKRGIKQLVKILKEVRVKDEKELEEGKELTVELFENVKKVNVVGISKGKGFQGVMKRHGFGGGRMSHGSKIHRTPGSTGAATYPGRVMKGKKLPGHTGNERITVKNLKVEKILKDENLLLVRGAVPGPNGGLVIVKNSEFRRG